MNLKDLFGSLELPPGVNPEAVKEFSEILGETRMCDNQEECKRILLRNGMQEAAEVLKVGTFQVTFATVRVQKEEEDWFGLIVGLITPEDKEPTFLGLAIPPSRKEQAMFFFGAIILTISKSMGEADKIEVRCPTKPS